MEAILWAFDVAAMVVLVAWSVRREKIVDANGAEQRGNGPGR